MATRVKQRSATAGDKSLGEKIRARRIAAEMSQADLGTALGVSFQQVQKYEKGVNRVSAVRLEAIAAALKESVTYFQSGGAVSRVGSEMQELMTDPVNQRMLRALSQIEDQALRFQFVRLVERVSSGEGPS